MKKIFILFLGLLIAGCAFSQGATNMLPIPRLTPPSPDAAALGRYGEFPVTLATGTPQISVPLYEINTGKLKLPISISYHASGIRVNDVASRVGLGWSLQAGGVITRVVRAQPDENGYFLHGIPLPGDTTTALLCFVNNLLYSGYGDSEPDIFYYNTPQKSGKFVYPNRVQVGTDPIPVSIPYDLVRIGFSFGGRSTITDVDGTVYIYGTSLAGRPAYETMSGIGPDGPIYHAMANVNSSWYLTEVISPDKSDTIKLIYSDQYNVTGETRIATAIRDKQGDGGIPHYITYSTSLTRTDIAEIRLKEIYFRNGKVGFEYNSSGRLDQSGDSSLTGLRVYQFVNNAYNEIKRYTLYQSYFNCKDIAPQNANGTYYTTPSKRLRLDSLKQIDIAGVPMPGYSFGYVATQLPNLASYAQDFWGFYNAVNNTKLLILDAPHSFNNTDAPSTTYGANRNVNPDSVDAGMLNKITFPTGGYSTFKFESNTYGATKVGGIRIKKIVSYDGLGGGFVKSYNYFDPTPVSSLYNGGDPSTLGAFFARPYTSIEDYSATNHSSILRSYESYFENLTAPIGSSSGAAVSYGRVEELYDSTNGANGKNVYFFDVSRDNAPSLAPQNVVTNEWVRGTKLGEQKYKSTSPGNFTLLNSKQYIYNYTIRPAFSIFSLATTVSYTDMYSSGIITGTPGCPSYSIYTRFFEDYNPIIIGNNLLSREIDTVFDQNGLNPQIDTTDYYYDDTLNVVPLRIEKKNSKGILIKTIIRTPLEKAAINSAMALTTQASAAIDSMLVRNIISPTIDQDKYYGAFLTQRTRTNYKNFTSKLVAPSDFQLKNGNAAIETRVQFNNYDNYGNIISAGKPGDAITTYLWDYQKAFVVAEVHNADSASVAYTSFESDGNAGWTATDTARNRSYALTGSQCYNLITGKTISKTVPSGKAYVVSYWSRSGSISITANGVGISVTLTGLIKNGWTYYEHLLPNTTTSVNITASNALIDELRLFPQGSQMTTYTYKPLVGLSSACSANNTFVYYEYDSFNRLRAIRDMDKNVVKAFDYQYQASPHTLYSVAKSGTFRRSNCTSCKFGTYVTYTVPANTYTSVVNQSDADQKGQNDVNIHGQAYADSLGTCYTPTTAPITGANGTTKDFTLSFHNTCTGTNYGFTLHVTTGTPITPIPEGNYDITISPVGGAGTYNYRVNGFVQNTTNASYFGIYINSSTNTIIIN